MKVPRSFRENFRQVDVKHALFNGVFTAGFMFLMNLLFHFFPSVGVEFYLAFGVGTALGSILQDVLQRSKKIADDSP
jgi:hypothetical protein